MKKNNLHFLLFSIFLTTILSFNINAQTSISLKGTVGDEHGGKVPGAQVTVRSEAGLQLSTATDEAGVFVFKELKPGNYLIEVRADGFSIYSHDAVQLTRGESKELNITLGIASINESVVITATGTAQRST